LHHTKLTLSERRLIATWRESGISIRGCARRLDRSHSTVVRELKRNRFKRNIYEPLHAHGKAEKRKARAWKAKHPLKNKDVYGYVTQRLRRGWSPEVISGRLREIDHPGDPHWQVCPETIYRFIYHSENKDQAWWEYLRRKQKRRREKGKRKAHRIRIPDRVSIHQRPGVINQRKEFGHWEGDTLVGKGRNHGLHTAYERVSSLTRFEKMDNLSSLASFLTQKKIYRPLPPKARKSTTLDNGSEHVLHQKLKDDLGVQSYFADPYSSWQRGGNENANLWIRYYFPKGTDFRTISDEDLKDVEWELNNRPRKRLNYRTPLEVFKSYLVQS
jgi:IS30 family transposase